MGGDFLNEIFKAHGLLALIGAAQCCIIYYLYQEKNKLQEQLLTLYRERISDVTESKERYEELAHKLDDSIDLLIKVFKRNSD